jgi:ABC-type uncharacterized transport system substrate-binding protein
MDLIVTSSTPAAQAAKQATSTIPIVVTFIADPSEADWSPAWLGQVGT